MVPANNGVYFGISMTANDIYTIAGNGTQGESGDGGPATSAVFSSIANGGVAVDPNGNLYIGDVSVFHSSYTSANKLRFVPAVSGTYFGISMAANNIYTIAGNGCCVNGNYTYYSYTTGTSASVGQINGIGFDPWGNVIYGDNDSNNIERLIY